LHKVVVVKWEEHVHRERERERERERDARDWIEVQRCDVLWWVM
jgi:hypothetical protein